MRTDRVCYDLLSIRLFPIVDAYIQENARDINLYLEFNSMDDVSTIINQLKAQNCRSMTSTSSATGAVSSCISSSIFRSV